MTKRAKGEARYLEEMIMIHVLRIVMPTLTIMIAIYLSMR
jgi:hypothetical protein